ncbi:MAG: 2-C-methyl-D-erythritol 2,4-cyclodiphosphate synthase [Synergistaceae bacterium]|nr:2-C-methyl-D-erythritol 2,4-cyclodiphosphate synthase [Synergistaceae bacterium]
MTGKNFSFIIAAGGSGTRMGGKKKQFMTLDNKPLWQWSADEAEKLRDSGIQEIIIVLPEGYSVDWPNHSIPLKIAKGGSTRAESVCSGLKESSCDYVLVHDAARPLATQELFARLMDSVNEDCGVVPVLPVSDALKRIDDNNISCVDRDNLYITQTPQVFPRMKLFDVLKNCPDSKDEAEAWLKVYPDKLKYVDGEKFNFKITTDYDMRLARSLVSNNKIIRTGLGFDVHKLVPERKLILGGVLIDSSLGLLGHSDADLLTHSIMDSILGAAGLPDIGNLFPASDLRYKNIDSIKLLREVLNLVNSQGWRVEFVDSFVCAQVPRLNKYREIIINNLSQFFNINLKFKSAEKLDDSGRGLSMTCQSIATLSRLNLGEA